MKLEIYASFSADLIRESLQNSLSTKQLAEFALSLGDNLTDEGMFYLYLKKRFDKLNVDMNDLE